LRARAAVKPMRMSSGSTVTPMPRAKATLSSVDPEST